MQQQNSIFSQNFLEELAETIAQKLGARFSVMQPPPEPQLVDDEPLHGDKAIAKYLGISTQTVWDWKRKGKLPFHRFGKGYDYYISEIKAAGYHPITSGKSDHPKKGQL